MNKHKANHQGMTLIELLVYIGVATIFLIAISGFAFTLLGTHRQTQTYYDLYTEVHIVADQMSRIISNGYAIDASSTFDNDLARQPGYVQISVPDANGYVQFFVHGGSLMIQEGTASAIPLHGQQTTTEHFFISNFSSGSSTHMYFSLTFSRAVGFGLPRAEVTIQTSVELLNYAP